MFLSPRSIPPTYDLSSEAMRASCSCESFAFLRVALMIVPNA